jgi:hypothetical protein
MANDDWRITIEVEDEHSKVFTDHFGDGQLVSPEALQLADDLKGRRLAVSLDDRTIFVYAGSRADAERARQIIEAELKSLGIPAKTSQIDHWLESEERWDDEPKEETWEQEELDEGYAPWEVHVNCGSHHEAKALADKLEQEGYRPVRRWRYLIVGTASKADAESLAKRLHGEVELGGEVVYEEMPKNRFALFGGLGA